MKQKSVWLTALMACVMCMGGLSLSACGDDGGDGPTPPKVETIDGYEFVDLGLSVKWATCNVGTTNPLSAGGFFQYGNPDSYAFRSENNLPTYEVGATSLDPAYARMSSKWRMPTRAEMAELVNGCDWVVTNSGGTRYYVGTSLRNGNRIYLPAAGAYPLGSSNGSVLYENQQCWLMTSTLNDSGNPCPYVLKIQYLTDANSSIQVTDNGTGRYSAMPVRGVAPPRPTAARRMTPIPMTPTIQAKIPNRSPARPSMPRNCWVPGSTRMM